MIRGTWNNEVIWNAWQMFSHNIAELQPETLPRGESVKCRVNGNVSEVINLHWMIVI